MNISLPAAVLTFFDISNGADASRVAACFHPSATVIDENQTYQGLVAIEAWQRKTRQTFTYRVEPLEASDENTSLVVKANVVGDFPGSPVKLNHLFVLQEGQIRSLEIKP